MKISAKLTAIIFAAIAAFTSISCEKNESNLKPETIYGSFTHDGKTYNIRSVVLYTMDNGQTEIWMSETAGYTTVDQIEASVGKLIINIRTAAVINRDELRENAPKENLWIKYDDNINNGMHVIKCEKNESNKTINISFRSTDSAFSNKIEGSYNGPYSEYSVPALNNQWSYNRQAKDITSADYFEMEDGKPSRLVLYDQDGEAINLTFPANKIGSSETIKIGDESIAGARIEYDNGDVFEISKSAGTIKILPNKQEKTLNVLLKLTNSAGKTLRADYQGAYRHRYGNKENRCIYDSGSEGYGWNGKFYIDGMTVNETYNDVTFTFNPVERADGKQIDKLLLPTLKVSNNLVNKGEVDIYSTTFPWNFRYHTFQVYSNGTENQYTSEPGSVLSVDRNDDGKYTVNIEVSYLISKPVTQNKVDENGNIVYTEVHKTDDFGTPLYDKNNDPIMEKVPETETVNVDFPTTIDLFFTQAN